MNYYRGLAKSTFAIVLFGMLMSLQGCQSAYYNAWEKLGVEKRDILVSRVENGKEAQEDAAEQFSSALEQFSSVVNFDGGDLEKAYDALNSEYQDSVDAAEEVSSRIEKIEAVANALFEEWEEEIEQYSNARFKADSQKQLRDTKKRYGSLTASMKKAEKSMQPVLTTMNDNVLYLKHNLNAQAIGALKGEYKTIKRDIDALIGNMNQAIERSNQFIESMQK